MSPAGVGPAAGPPSPLRAALRDHVVPAVPVPFGVGGEIDETLQQAYAAWMAAQPVGGVAIWAHTGRGLHLTPDQRAAVLASWRRNAPRLPVVCGVGVPISVRLPAAPADRTDAACRAAAEMAAAAAAGGAAGVLIHPPIALAKLPDADARVVAYHEAVLSAGLPGLAFFLYEDAGGVSYSLPQIERLLSLPGVVGIKVATLDSVMTYQDVALAVRAVPGALLVTGEDRFLAYSLTLGAAGALVGMAAACTDVCARLVAARRRSAEEFLAVGEALDRFGQATFVRPMEGYVQRMLWALEADGVLPEAGRDPFGPPLSLADRLRVTEAVRALRSS